MSFTSHMRSFWRKSSYHNDQTWKVIEAIAGGSNIISIDAYDDAMTNAEETVTVYCCRPDNTPVSVHCGLGLSCAGKCSAQGATLCPTGDCSGTCEVTLDQEAPPPPTTSGGVLPPSTQPSEAFRRCFPKCKVKGEENQHCCFHPECLKLRPRLCSWVNDLTGKKKDWTNTFRGRNTCGNQTGQTPQTG